MAERYTRLNVGVQDQASLASAADALHDAVFDLENVFFDEVAGIFRLTVWREVPELARRERVLLLLHRVRMPLVRSVLAFAAVKRAVVERSDPNVSGAYCLEEILYDSVVGRLRFAIMGPLAIELEVDQLIGSLKDVGDPTWDVPSIPTFGIGP